jgi:hypothetical protein
MIQTLQPRLLAGLSLAHRFSQLTCGGGRTAGGSTDDTTLLSCYKPLEVPDIDASPLGPLDPDAWEAWLHANPSLYDFQASRWLLLNKQSVAEAVEHNAFKPDEMATIQVCC